MPDNTIQAFRELGKFIGAKLDALSKAVLSQKVSIEMGDASKTTAQHLIEHFKPLFERMATDSKLSKKEITQALSQLKINVPPIEVPHAKIDVNIPPIIVPEPRVTVTIPEIKSPVIPDIKVPEPKVTVNVPKNDFSPITKELKTMKDDMKKWYAIQGQYMSDMSEAISLLAKKEATYPSEFKLEKGQLAAITHGGMATGSNTMAARNGVTRNVAMATANTQYSTTFPANTSSFFVRLRDPGTDLLCSWQTGTLPTSGDGSAYMTIPAFGYRSPDNLDIGGKTFYFQTGSASMTAEFEIFTAT
jgi:hypothetical protein